MSLSPEKALPSVPSTRLATFYRGLSVVYGSGVRIDDALLCLKLKGDPDPLEPILDRTSLLLRTGQPLWASLRLSGAFPNMHIQLVRIGELTGTLDVALSGLADYQERTCAVESKVKSALAYPAIMLVVCLLALLIIPGMMFTPIFDFLHQSGVEIPWMTQVLLLVLGLLGKPITWFIMLLGGVLFYRDLRKKDRLRLTKSREMLLLKLPAAGNARRHLVTARFLRSLEPALASGCPMLTAFELAADCADSPLLKKQVQTLLSEITEGSSLERALLNMEFIPRTYLQALAVGSESGRLDTMIGTVANLVELEFESALESLLGLLEPVIMLGIGLLVGLVIAATMSPMLELIRSIA